MSFPTWLGAYTLLDGLPHLVDIMLNSSRVGSGPPGFNLTRKKVKKQQAEQVEFLSFY
jgi:hypothetical protein